MAAVSGGRLAQLREQAPRLLKKYRLPLLIFLAGLILSLIHISEPTRP